MVQIPRLREWRELQGWTQKDLARESGVSARSIAGYEAGASARPGTTRKLAEALGVEVADLVLTSGKEPAPPSPEQPSFNGLLAEERRVLSLRSWTTLVNALADRWDQEITERETEWQAAKPAAKKFVKWLPNLNWGTEIRRTAADLWAVASDELETSLGAYTSDEALDLYRALRKLDGVIDRTDDWYAWNPENKPEGATVHDIAEAEELRATRKAAVERIGRQLGA